MRLQSLSTILIPLVLGGAALQTPPAACVIAGADVPAALAEAQAGSRCLELPAGEYAVTQTAGNWLNITVDDVELRGAGVGKTVIRMAETVTLTGNFAFIRTVAARTWVHDLAIVNAAHAGPPNTTMYGVMAHYEPYAGGFRGATSARFERLDIAGVWGNTAAGGFGIFLGQYSGLDAGYGWHTVAGVTVHDSPDATGMLIGAHGSTIRNSRVVNVGGASFTKHGLYIQAGHTLVEDCYLDRAGSFAIHGYKNAAGMDGSGDRYIGNTIVNPGFQHIYSSGGRSVEVSGNTLIETDGRETNGILTNGPALIAGNVLEDVRKGGGPVIRATGAGSIVRDNRIAFPTFAGAALAPAIDLSGPRSIASGNVLDIGPLNDGIWLCGGCIATNNQILSTVSGAGRKGIVINGDGAIVTGNRIEVGYAPWPGAIQGGGPHTVVTQNVVIVQGVYQ